MDLMKNSTANGTLTQELLSVWLLLYLLVLPILPICCSLAVALAADAVVIDVALTVSKSTLTVMTLKNMTLSTQDITFKPIWRRDTPDLNCSPNTLRLPSSSNSGHAWHTLPDSLLCILLVSSSSWCFTPFKSAWSPRNTPSPSNSTRIYLWILINTSTLATSSTLLLVFSCTVTPSFWSLPLLTKLLP